VIHAIDQVQLLVGKTFAWLIVALTFVSPWKCSSATSSTRPRPGFFDFNNMLYRHALHDVRRLHPGAGGHVRARFRLTPICGPGCRPRSTLRSNFLFFIPGILGLIYAGYDYAAKLSWRNRRALDRHRRGSSHLPLQVGDPDRGLPWSCSREWPRSVRCIECLRTGAWPPRLSDVEEIDVIDPSSRRASTVDEEVAPRGDGLGEGDRRGPLATARLRQTTTRGRRREQPGPRLTMLGLHRDRDHDGASTAFTLMGLG